MDLFMMNTETSKSIVAPFGLNDATKVDTLLTSHRLAVIFQRKDGDLLVWNSENRELLVSRFISLYKMSRSHGSVEDQESTSRSDSR